MQSIGTFLVLLFLLLGQTTQGQVWNVVTIQFENLQTNNGSIMLLVQNDFEKEVFLIYIFILNNLLFSNPIARNTSGGIL